MSQASWVVVLDESELQEDTINLAFPDGISILMIKKDGRIYALRNRCAHMSCTLAGGHLEGYLLRCPCHRWIYDIRTGEFIDYGEIKIPLYKCKAEAGKIYVNLWETAQ